MSPELSWTERQIELLIELCATPTQQKISGDTYRLFTRELERQMPKKGADADFNAEVIRRAVGSTLAGRRLTISMLVGTCAIQAISVKDLLLSPKQAAARTLIGPAISYRSLELVERRRTNDKELLEACLKEFRRLRRGSRVASRQCIEQILRSEFAGCDRSGKNVNRSVCFRSEHLTTRTNACPPAASRDDIFKIAFETHKALQLNRAFGRPPLLLHHSRALSMMVQ